MVLGRVTNTTLSQDVTANKRKMKELEENLLFKLTSIQVVLSPYPH